MNYKQQLLHTLHLKNPNGKKKSSEWQKIDHELFDWELSRISSFGCPGSSILSRKKRKKVWENFEDKIEERLSFSPITNWFYNGCLWLISFAAVVVRKHLRTQNLFDIQWNSVVIYQVISYNDYTVITNKFFGPKWQILLHKSTRFIVGNSIWDESSSWIITITNIIWKQTNNFLVENTFPSPIFPKYV